MSLLKGIDYAFYLFLFLRLKDNKFWHTKPLEKTLLVHTKENLSIEKADKLLCKWTNNWEKEALQIDLMILVKQG